MPEKYKLKEIFKDTLSFIEKDAYLRASTEKSTEATRYYPSDFAEEVSTKKAAINTKAMNEAFYLPHKSQYDFRGWDDCIYSPGVVICRDDTDELPARLNPKNFVGVDVITCAAPHLRDDIITAEDLFNIHVRRAKNILRICAFNGVDIFIGGAFGCGAFHNDPYIVAWAWREALKEYREKFGLVMFAVYSHGDEESNNYRAFRNEFAAEEKSK